MEALRKFSTKTQLLNASFVRHFEWFPFKLGIIVYLTTAVFKGREWLLLQFSLRSNTLLFKEAYK